MLMATAGWSGTSVGHQPAANGPFADAAMVPADVSLYVHVTDAASIRRDVAGRPIGQWLETLAADSAFAGAWETLAATSRLDHAALFDHLLGERFTLVARFDGAAPQWCIMTEVHSETMRTLRRAWRVQRQPPRHGLAVSVLPEQDIILAENGRSVVIGSRSQPALFDAVITGAAGAKSKCLADVERFSAKRELFIDKRSGVFIRHSAFIGGWSMIGFDLHGNDVQLRHAAVFENPPFERQVTKIECDFTALRNFERDQLVAIMEPTDIGASRLETFAMQHIGEALAGADLHKAIGKRRIVAIGEEDGRMRDVPEDILSPVLAIIIEVDAEHYSIEMLDQQVSRLATKLNDACDGALLVQVPPTRVYQQGHPREIDISAAVSTFSGGFPMMKTLTLNWDVTDGAGSTWCIVAGSPDQLQSVVTSLRAATNGERVVGVFDSVGTINGLRLGRQLENWGEQAETLAGPGQADELRQAVNVLGGLIGSTDRVRWKMCRPDRRQMHLDVQITLRDAPSAGESSSD